MLFDNNANQNQPTPEPIPAMEFLLQATKYCWENRKDFIALALLPVVVLTFANTLLTHFYPAPVIAISADQTELNINEFRLLSTPLGLFLQSMFSVAAFRYLLLDEENITIYSAIKWDPYKTAFLVRFIQIMGIFIAASFGSFLLVGLVTGNSGPQISPIHIIGFFLVFLVLYAKFMMSLPAAAIGEKLSLKQSWHISTGNVWRIITITALPFIPITLASVFIGNIMTSAFGMDQILGSLTLKFIYNFATEFLGYVYVTIMTVAIGFTYRKLTEDIDLNDQNMQ